MTFVEVLQTDPESLGLELLEPGSNDWPRQMAVLREALGSPNNPDLFPPHFLKTTFPKIGGVTCAIKAQGEILGALFVFPGKDPDRNIARLHVSPKGKDILERGYIYETLVWAGVSFELYDLSSGHSFTETHARFGDFDLGRPSEAEAQEVRRLQRTIWGASEDFLYPADIHSDEFRTATSLVARKDGEAAGFLFGFYKRTPNRLPEAFSDKYRSDLRVESQLLGVLPDYRGKGVGFELKKAQAVKAREEALDVINWTVDPLQFSNAVLNFGKLRGISFGFFPDYYQFRNELNQTTTSRIEITWLINSPIVQEALSKGANQPSNILSLANIGEVARINRGAGGLDLSVEGADWLAIEVPDDWTRLQKENPDLANDWRETTDRAFSHYLGPRGKGYAITDVAYGDDVVQARERYLLARRIENIPGV